MGQGVAVTRLQMVMAMGAIANDGWLMRPMLVNRLEDRNGNVVQQYAPQRVRQVVSEATDKLMIEALKTVVTPDGTAPGAAMKDYTVAGKTGTAQKVENGAYAEHKYYRLVHRIFPGGQSAALHFRRDGRAEGRLLRRPGLRPGLQGNRRTLRQLFEHSAGQEFGTAASPPLVAAGACGAGGGAESVNQREYLQWKHAL